jgi:hypothetical protein
LNPCARVFHCSETGLICFMENEFLTRCGVPNDVQGFFGVNDLSFSYGTVTEKFEAGFHFVPTTAEIWLAGNQAALEVIVTSSVMEGIAYCSLNRHRYPALNKIVVASLGNCPQFNQLQQLNAFFPGRNFTLVFGRDLLGMAADIWVATALCGLAVSIMRKEKGIDIYHNGQTRSFGQEQVSLSAFQKAFGIRTRCRTRKPKNADTFLHLLLNFQE